MTWIHHLCKLCSFEANYKLQVRPKLEVLDTPTCKTPHGYLGCPDTHDAHCGWVTFDAECHTHTYWILPPRSSEVIQERLVKNWWKRSALCHEPCSQVVWNSVKISTKDQTELLTSSTFGYFLSTNGVLYFPCNVGSPASKNWKQSIVKTKLN